MLLAGPWTEHSSTDLSIQDFRTATREHLQTIEAARAAVEETYHFFSHPRKVRPSECDVTTSSVAMLHKPVKNLCQLLGHSWEAPAVIIPYRYNLLVPSYQLGDQVDHLNALITTFRSVCLERATYVIRQQHTIQGKLEQLVQSSYEIERQGKHLIDQTYWHRPFDTEPIAFR